MSSTCKTPSKKRPSALSKPVSLSSELEAVVGKGPMPRTEVTSNLWKYIKKYSLQDSSNKRMINPDDKLSKVFGGNTPINMFEMTKRVSKHIS